MPRKPTHETTKITVVVDGMPTQITLFAPNGTTGSWYAYWTGQPNSRSTGAKDLQDAIAAAEAMVRNGGKRVQLPDTVMSDDEFREIQRHHFQRKQAPDAAIRASKSLTTCLEAIDAFKQISALAQIALATPDDCAKFQRTALELPKSWRLKYPRARKEGVPRLSPNTVVKWSTSLAAAFERANINGGRKCVRGVVEEGKLLKANPWRQFLWIEGFDRPKRQFSDAELLSILDYFEKKLPGVTAATAAIKTSLWAWARLSEMARLEWSDMRLVGEENHFEIIGKWGIEKWARLPAGLITDLVSLKNGNDYVFAAYTTQLRRFYERSGQTRFANLVGDQFSPEAFASWFQERIRDWADQTGHPHATHHTFRKTALQHARRGEDINRQVAQDAKLSESVMMGHYVNDRDEELRQASNRTYTRILLSLSVEVATRYGYKPDDEAVDLEKRLEIATGIKDWKTVEKLASELASRTGQAI